MAEGWYVADDEKFGQRLGVLDERTATIITQMVQLVGKVEQLYDMTRAVAAMQERQEQQGSAIDRAFVALERTDARLVQAIKDCDAAHEKIHARIDLLVREAQAEAAAAVQAHSTTRARVDRWTNRALGGWAVGVVLIAALGWFIARQIAAYDDAVKYLQSMQIAQEKRATEREYNDTRRARAPVSNQGE